MRWHMKKKLRQRFLKAYPKKRILAVQLNGFSHKVFYDSGLPFEPVKCDEWSGCMPEGQWSSGASLLFNGIGHSSYQNNAQEIVYVNPEER